MSSVGQLAVATSPGGSISPDGSWDRPPVAEALVKSVFFMLIYGKIDNSLAEFGYLRGWYGKLLKSKLPCTHHSVMAYIVLLNINIIICVNFVLPIYCFLTVEMQSVIKKISPPLIWHLPTHCSTSAFRNCLLSIY